LIATALQPGPGGVACRWRGLGYERARVEEPLDWFFRSTQEVADAGRELLAPAMAVPVACFLVLLACELLRPLRRPKRRRAGRYFVNAALTALALGAGALVAAAALWLTAWSSRRGVGILRIAPMPVAARWALGFVLLDLTFYYWHMANHKLRILWRFHNVHHVDPDLDVTTSFRFHFCEVLYSSVFRLAQVVAIGATLELYIVYELVFTCATMFHHSNVRLPLVLERMLNLVFVTPRMHGVHHSTFRDETDSNYSVVFSWWDMLHRSMRLNVRQDGIAIGVPGYVEPGDNSVGGLLVQPFVRQRRYWKTAEKMRPAEASPGAAGLMTMSE
jgi:sterol desaturase/sphingolipid hydroxylase (fatty acid hydroxylase superfamily)